MRSRSLVIVGGGGLGRETIALANSIRAHERDPFTIDGVLASTAPNDEAFLRFGVPYLGDPADSAVLAALPNACSFVIAIGDGSVRDSIRSRLFAAGLSETTLVHPSAVVMDDVEIMGGIVAAGAVLTTAVRIGRSCVIDVGCTVSHDAILGDSVTLSPGVNVTGGVRVADRVTIFAGATVAPRVRIGNDAVVGAGALVLVDVAAESTVVGVPATPIKR